MMPKWWKQMPTFLFFNGAPNNETKLKRHAKNMPKLVSQKNLNESNKSSNRLTLGDQSTGFEAGRGEGKLTLGNICWLHHYFYTFCTLGQERRTWWTLFWTRGHPVSSFFFVVVVSVPKNMFFRLTPNQQQIRKNDPRVAERHGWMPKAPDFWPAGYPGRPRARQN